MFSLILVLIIVFASCTNDYNENTSQNQIIGKWEVTTGDVTENGKPVVITDEESIIGTILEFNLNLSYTIKFQSALLEAGTYIVNGGAINFTPTDEDQDTYSLIFNISDDVLYIYNHWRDDDNDFSAEIVATRIN